MLTLSKIKQQHNDSSHSFMMAEWVERKLSLRKVGSSVSDSVKPMIYNIDTYYALARFLCILNIGQGLVDAVSG